MRLISGGSARNVVFRSRAVLRYLRISANSSAAGNLMQALGAQRAL
jgi:phage terminase Nu1 subunit (DNA packaging protein)